MQQNNKRQNENPKQSDDPKDQFITSSLTLRKLQLKKKVPPKISAINLQTQQIRYDNTNQGSKYLLISTKNIVYFGQLNSHGYPDSNSGIFIYSDGSYYEGVIRNGKPEGTGLITNIQNSYSYLGEWKKGMPDGYGKQVIGNNVYQGTFQRGKKHGQGKLQYQDGSYYEGMFNHNVIQGPGRMFNKNNYWEGQWKSGYLQGKGIQVISKNQIKSINEIQELKQQKDISIYIGQFVKGQKSGNGLFKWNRNYQYDGRFQKGQLHGEGTFKFKGKAYAGVWSNGTEVKITQLVKGAPSVLMGSTNFNDSVLQKKKISQQNKNSQLFKIPEQAQPHKQSQQF